MRLLQPVALHQAHSDGPHRRSLGTRSTPLLEKLERLLGCLQAVLVPLEREGGGGHEELRVRLAEPARRSADLAAERHGLAAYLEGLLLPIGVIPSINVALDQQGSCLSFLIARFLEQRPCLFDLLQGLIDAAIPDVHPGQHVVHGRLTSSGAGGLKLGQRLGGEPLGLRSLPHIQSDLRQQQRRGCDTLGAIGSTEAFQSLLGRDPRLAVGVPRALHPRQRVQGKRLCEAVVGPSGVSKILLRSLGSLIVVLLEEQFFHIAKPSRGIWERPLEIHGIVDVEAPCLRRHLNQQMAPPKGGPAQRARSSL
mmetsp:Transcript_170203/g.545849  ORF Transcript_170203/g.545849 Transcript_170203/m.545849 type:complete len:309 (-) Transcript_170203:10-936(-)